MKHQTARQLCIILACACATQVKAQLVDESQIGSTVPLGAISESLEEQIGAGRGDTATPLSSIYLIKRDPARAIRTGRQLFQRKFTFAQGLGPRVNPHSTGDISSNAAFGAGLIDSCAGCHGRPKGAAGFGGVVPTRPDSRDAPHLFGLGLQEMLADEITGDLREQREQALNTALDSGASVTKALVSKGIAYGEITANEDGTMDTSKLHGVDSDLRVRPFFAQGGEFSIRNFIIGAFKDEMGLEVFDPDMKIASLGRAVTTPSGLVLDGTQETFKAPPVESYQHDGDGDGVINEVDPAAVDFLEFYLLNYFKPGIGKQTARSDAGLEIINQIGCTTCHVKDLTIETDRRIADVETVFDPDKGKFNRLYATGATRWIMEEDGDPYPKLLPEGKSFVVENIFTDFKRHDLGETFHERNYDGSLTKQIMTEPLWGVGSTAPYGHDGRSINLEEVILRHGGEAQEQRDQFAALSDDDQRMVIEYLQTLVLFPPDDTASNLNPGDYEISYQDPAGHGTINLGALFQISDLSTLPRKITTHSTGQSLELKWFGSKGKQYTLQASRDFVTWESVTSTESVTGGMITFSIPQEGDYRYFRVRH